MRILIDNALRYAPRGRADRGHRRARRHAASSCASPTAARACPEDEREHIFERFHRGKATSVESGFGLGLAIGRELAERMGGTLELADSSSRGALLRADAAG